LPPAPAEPVPVEGRPGRGRRPLLIAAGALAVVLPVAVAALLSWHFSSAVVVPDRSGWPEDVTVEALRPGQAVLSRSDDTLRPGVYGLLWQGGHAIVGRVLARDDSTVTRRLRGLRGYLAPGSKVAIDSYVYSGNPREARGLAFSPVRIPGELGPMPAWLIPGRSRVWAIVVHGINSDPQAGLRIAPELHRIGLAQLLITYRDDLGAPPSPDGYHHMGLTEWRDVQAAARFALAHGARRLLLVGYSMGGALVTQFMEKSSLANRVAGLVLDAPVLDWRATLEFNATRMGLPGFLANPVEWAIDVRIDPDWDSVDALRHPEDFHLPILLFHGSDDNVVPISTSEAFAAELPEWVEFHRVPDAGHTESWNVDPARYAARLGDFLESALESQKPSVEGTRTTPKKVRARPPGPGSRN
jgi:alpha-beta hydrolase superfamily lysophospholipase